ncbi:MAG: hypothetical protein P4L53_17290 [Candidatus Obscuribacterales bacterium]|nr:hypothetical protein [Candidatus Obscuribacterales bacterium]
MISPSLETLKRIALSTPPVSEKRYDKDLVKSSSDYLQSDEALESIEKDPYWPKWNSPWWHMLLLHELDLAEHIPKIAVDRMVVALNHHYLPVFPVREEELSPGVDPLGQIACHCQLGEMEQVLTACGVNVGEQIPFLYSWYSRYQLQDGGLNCDESAYIKDRPVSSIVSTLPPLEAVLFSRASILSKEDHAFLERGAKYLIDKKLFRSVRSKSPINAGWTKLCFPRFYEYDVLRGLHFLLSWATATRKLLRAEAILETVSLIDQEFPDGHVSIQRSIWNATSTRFFNPQNKTWSKSLAEGFPLLESVSVVGNRSPYLTAIWTDAKLKLIEALEEDLICLN